MRVLYFTGSSWSVLRDSRTGEFRRRYGDSHVDPGGINRAVAKEMEVEVTDGVLDFEFPQKEGATPMINGIEVMRK